MSSRRRPSFSRTWTAASRRPTRARPPPSPPMAGPTSLRSCGYSNLTLTPSPIPSPTLTQVARLLSNTVPFRISTAMSQGASAAVLKAAAVLAAVIVVHGHRSSGVVVVVVAKASDSASGRRRLLTSLPTGRLVIDLPLYSRPPSRTWPSRSRPVAPRASTISSQRRHGSSCAAPPLPRSLPPASAPAPAPASAPRSRLLGRSRST